MQLVKGAVLATAMTLSCFTLETQSADYYASDSINRVTSFVQEECDSFLQPMYDVQLKGFDIPKQTYNPAEEEKILWSEVPPDGEGVCRTEARTYMDYHKVRTVSSDQYKLLYSDLCYTDPASGLRMVGDRYCIAVGTHYAYKIGTKINVVMANGATVKCILGDVKADEHTDPTHRYQKWDGSVVEVIVDGTVFKGTHMYPSELVGKIVRIDIVDDDCEELCQQLGLERDWVPGMR